MVFPKNQSIPSPLPTNRPGSPSSEEVKKIKMNDDLIKEPSSPDTITSSPDIMARANSVQAPSSTQLYNDTPPSPILFDASKTIKNDLLRPNPITPPTTPKNQAATPPSISNFKEIKLGNSLMHPQEINPEYQNLDSLTAEEVSLFGQISPDKNYQNGSTFLGSSSESSLEISPPLPSTTAPNFVEDFQLDSNPSEKKSSDPQRSFKSELRQRKNGLTTHKSTVIDDTSVIWCARSKGTKPIKTKIDKQDEKKRYTLDDF